MFSTVRCLRRPGRLKAELRTHTAAKPHPSGFGVPAFAGPNARGYEPIAAGHPNGLSTRFLAGAMMLAAAVATTSPLRAQTTATIGYATIADGAGLNANLFTATGIENRSDVYVPFQINTLGNYSLTSVSLLLAGTGNVSGLTLLATSSLGTANGTPGSSVAIFSGSGTLSGTASVFTFNASSSSTLAANTTYYLYLGFNSATDINWIRASVVGEGGSGLGAFGDAGGSGGGGFNPITGTIATTTSTGTFRFFVSGYGTTAERFGANFPGISITASAMSAVPEPSTYAAICGAGALVAAIVIRRRRRS